jgi:hypothetical protein
MAILLKLRRRCNGFPSVAKRLDWMIRCVKRVLECTAQEKVARGGTVPDEALHITIKALHEVYFGFAEDARYPARDISADDRFGSLTDSFRLPSRCPLSGAKRGVVTLIESAHASDGFKRPSRRDRHMSP